MGDTVNLLHSLEDLDAAVERSSVHPIVIFKHSETCGRSAMALREVEAFVARNPSADVFLVSVQAAARVSAEIAARFSVRHESPQALVIHKGVVAWHASHSQVSLQEIAAALDAARDTRSRTQ